MVSDGEDGIVLLGLREFSDEIEGKSSKGFSFGSGNIGANGALVDQVLTLWC